MKKRGDGMEVANCVGAGKSKRGKRKENKSEP